MFSPIDVWKRNGSCVTIAARSRNEARRNAESGTPSTVIEPAVGS
jgi:hypothetical protein